MMLSNSRKTHNIMKIQLDGFNDFVREATEKVVSKKKKRINLIVYPITL